MAANFQQLEVITKACGIPLTVVAHMFRVSMPTLKSWIAQASVPDHLAEPLDEIYSAILEAKASGVLPVSREDLLINGLIHITECGKADECNG